MFDTIIPTYKPLGPRFWNTECQTKDLICCMRRYWLNPAGELYEVNDDMCVDVIEKPESIQQELGKRWFDPFDYVPNNKHGLISPVDTTAIITIYPAIVSEEEMRDWPEAILYLRNGKVKEVIDIHQRPIWKPKQHTEP